MSYPTNIFRWMPSKEYRSESDSLSCQLAGVTYVIVRSVIDRIPAEIPSNGHKDNSERQNKLFSILSVLLFSSASHHHHEHHQEGLVVPLASRRSFVVSLCSRRHQAHLCYQESSNAIARDTAHHGCVLNHQVVD
jgi:hypothetical protein